MAVIVGATALSSCDDDEDDPKNYGASKIAGTYNGTISAKVMTFDCNIEGTYDVVIRNDNRFEDEVTVVIPACSYTNDNMPGVQTIPELTIIEVDVDRTGHDADKYILEEDDFSVKVDGVTYTGYIYGTVDGSSINLEYQITPGKMPMPINFTFAGTRNK